VIHNIVVYHGISEALKVFQLCPGTQLAELKWHSSLAGARLTVTCMIKGLCRVLAFSQMHQAYRLAQAGRTMSQAGGSSRGSHWPPDIDMLYIMGCQRPCYVFQLCPGMWLAELTWHSSLAGACLTVNRMIKGLCG
jgi:hypothetical protein